MPVAVRRVGPHSGRRQVVGGVLLAVALAGCVGGNESNGFRFRPREYP